MLKQSCIPKKWHSNRLDIHHTFLMHSHTLPNLSLELQLRVNCDNRDQYPQQGPIAFTGFPPRHLSCRPLTSTNVQHVTQCKPQGREGTSWLRITNTCVCLEVYATHLCSPHPYHQSYFIYTLREPILLSLLLISRYFGNYFRYTNASKKYI